MWNNLEHLIWNKLKRDHLDQQQVYLLAVSGGLDSVVLAEVFRKIKPQAKLVLMHYHHGDTGNQVYRDQCFYFLQDKASAGFLFESEKSTQALHSENDFRNARRAFFEKIKQKYQTDFYVTAHHQDDVLETRLLKLIRGTGLEGLSHFEEWNQHIYRPFFDVPKSILLQYANDVQLKWHEDPSNLENQYLRNWIRNEWLPALEQRSEGGVKNLAHSLQNITATSLNADRYETESARYVKVIEGQMSIDRVWLESFSAKDQTSVLIRALKSGFEGDFTTSQIKEVIRRLDKNQNERIFTVGGINWVINARNIVLSYNSLSKK